MVESDLRPVVAMSHIVLEGSRSVVEAERTSFNVCVALTLRVMFLFAEASQRRRTQIGGDVVDIQTEGNTNKVWYHYIMYQLRSDSDLPIVE